MKKYPDDIDKKSWDIMFEYTCYALTTIFILTVGIIVCMMINYVTWIICHIFLYNCRHYVSVSLYEITIRYSQGTMLARSKATDELLAENWRIVHLTIRQVETIYTTYKSL
mgnify:CR=1 FL=1